MRFVPASGLHGEQLRLVTDDGVRLAAVHIAPRVPHSPLEPDFADMADGADEPLELPALPDLASDVLPPVRTAERSAAAALGQDSALAAATDWSAPPLPVPAAALPVAAALAPAAGLPVGTGARTDLAFVVAHGFTGSTRRPAVQRICRRLSAYGAVVASDLRGHGESGGLCTMGADEVLDVDAAVNWARVRGYERVVTVGFSLGGSVVLRHAALVGGVDAVASVSAPSRWYILDTVPMRRVHWLCETTLGRATARMLGTRIGPGWLEPPESPLEVVGRIPPTPLLFVHGDRDSYFPLEHPHALHQAAGPEAQLWIESGYGHAESAMTPVLLDRVAVWLAAHTRLDGSGTIFP